MRLDEHAPRPRGSLSLRSRAGSVRGWIERALGSERMAEAALVMYIVSILSMLFLNA